MEYNVLCCRASCLRPLIFGQGRPGAAWRALRSSTGFVVGVTPTRHQREAAAAALPSSRSLSTTTALASSKSRSPSSSRYLARQKRDPFVKARANAHAQAHGDDDADADELSITAYRSRSAFKLEQMNAKFGFLGSRGRKSGGSGSGERGARLTVVDLGAAPGGWSQVVAGHFAAMARQSASARGRGGQGRRDDNDDDGDDDDGGMDEQRGRTNAKGIGRAPTVADREGRIIAVDLLPMEPIANVEYLQGDFLDLTTHRRLGRLLSSPSSSSSSPSDVSDDDDDEGKVNVVLSDMLMSTSGNRVRDAQRSDDLCRAVLSFADRWLLRTGTGTATATAGRGENDDAAPTGAASAEGDEEAGKKRDGKRRRGRGTARSSWLVMKHLHSDLSATLRKDILERSFERVWYEKPEASRKESREGYFVCRGFRGLRSRSGEPVVLF